MHQILINKRLLIIYTGVKTSQCILYQLDFKNFKKHVNT